MKRIIELFLTSNCDELALHVPITQDDLEKGARNFTNISSVQGIYCGAIIDFDLEKFEFEKYSTHTPKTFTREIPHWKLGADVLTDHGGF